MQTLHCVIAMTLIATAGCATRPFGADRVTTRKSYNQVEHNAINSGKPSAATKSLLHRYNLDELAATRADEAVRKLHPIAVSTGDRDLLFALAELSYAAGEQIRASLKAWDPRDAREFYLGSAVYAYLFLFSDGNTAKADAFDRRFRIACDLYNYGLGAALTDRRATNAVAKLQSEKRALPVGEIELQVDASHFPWPLEVADRFLVADQFQVRGLSVRNREAGLGAPLVAVSRVDESLRLRRAFPATVFLRLQGSLSDLSSNNVSGSLELYAGFDDDMVEVAGTKVPLERDLTTPAALVLSQSFAWKVEYLQFLKPGEAIKSQLIPSEPYAPGKIPLVFVHGTFSSPVWWAEMINTLRADPELRKRYQIWQFIYSSSKPVVVSAVELRDALAERINMIDPEGKDAALRQMVLVGHSQGGLLCKLAVTDTGDKLWTVFSDKRPEELDLTTNQLAMVQRYCFLEALPFVNRVIFISTPHRGSFMAKNFVRNLVRRLITAPSTMVQKSKELVVGVDESKLPPVLSTGKMPTSLDGMAPDNPFALALADIPPASFVTAHSIVAIDGDEEPPAGDDGVVAYTSAHVDYVESEFIVRSYHSCQDKPETIEEVRRILHLHLQSVPPAGN